MVRYRNKTSSASTSANTETSDPSENELAQTIVKCSQDIEQSVKCPLDIKDSVENEILSEQIIPKVITKSCVSCTSPDTAEMIQCNSCNKWIHYTCSMLPPYQSYIFMTSSRRY